MARLHIISVIVGLLSPAAFSARALNPVLPPSGNFDLSNWYLQLPTSNNILTGASGSVDSVSTAQLMAGFTNSYFYTGSDGAMTFWVPDNGAMTGGSSHPRSELRELLDPNNSGSNWTLYGTHVMTAQLKVLQVPSDTRKVCIGQIHEPNTKPDGGTSANNEQMIMFNLASQTIYVNINLDGDLSSSFSQTFISGSSVKTNSTINYTMSVVDGLLTIVVNDVTNSWNLFSGTNYQGHVATNWDNTSGNTVYFKAGDYNQTTNQCNCSTDGAKVAFYALALYHAPNITNQPASVAVNAGSNATFTVAASGNGILSYQWWFNATNLLAGTTNASLTVSNVSYAKAGNYTVVVSDSTSSFSSVTSVVATLIAIYPQTVVAFSTPGNTTWICPTGVSFVKVECWGGGGAGGSAVRTPNTGSTEYGGGGAGGAYARDNSYPVTPGNTYYVTVGSGGVAAIGTLTNNVTVAGGDSWFNSTSVEPTAAGSCVARGGAGGKCAVGNTSATAFGAGGVGTTNGSIGDVLFAGGSGGAVTSSTGYGGSGGGSGGTGSNGNPGGTNGAAAAAVTKGGPGGAPNATSGSSGPGQAPASGPGGGGGGARATAQQSGGNGAAGQVIITYANNTAAAAVITGFSMANDRGAFTLIGNGFANQTYVLLTASSLTPPVTWSPIATNNADVNGAFSFTDSQVTNFAQRFYRVGTP